MGVRDKSKFVGMRHQVVWEGHTVFEDTEAFREDVDADISKTELFLTERATELLIQPVAFSLGLIHEDLQPAQVGIPRLMPREELGFHCRLLEHRGLDGLLTYRVPSIPLCPLVKRHTHDRLRSKRFPHRVHTEGADDGSFTFSHMPSRVWTRNTWA